MSDLVVVVYGEPAPQGSKRAVRNKYTDRIQQVESSAKVKPWRQAVHYAALEALGGPDGWFPFRDMAVYVLVTFTLARPKGHYRTGRNAHLLRDAAPAYPTGKPDVDKLMRSTLDALASAGVLANDSQVVDCFGRKRYANTHPEALMAPGALIRIQAMDKDTAQLAAAQGMIND